MLSNIGRWFVLDLISKNSVDSSCCIFFLRIWLLFFLFANIWQSLPGNYSHHCDLGGPSSTIFQLTQSALHPTVIANTIYMVTNSAILIGTKIKRHTIETTFIFLMLRQKALAFLEQEKKIRSPSTSTWI